MPDTPAFLSERLLQEGEKSIAFFQSLTTVQLDQTIYTEGSHWTVFQVLAHFVFSENSLCRLVENVAAGGPGAPVNFDIDGYNERKVKGFEDTPPLELMEQFRENRKKTALVVANLQMDDLQRQGRHPFLGVVPLTDIIKIIYRHNQIHQREIRMGLAKE
jgi:hypothetical protein